MMPRAGLGGLGPSALTLGVLALILLAAAATFSWRLPVLGFAERWLHDFRTGAFAPVAAPHPGILIAAIDEETLARTRRRSPLDRALLARAVEALDAARPLAIGIDVLIDQPTPPADDALLADTLRASGTPVVLAYADVESSDGRVRDWQVEYLRGFLDTLEGGVVERGSIVLSADADGTLRRTPNALPDGTTPFALALARHAGVGTDQGGDAGMPIVYRRGAVDDIPFTMIPLHILADLPSRAVREVVGDKIVMIGSVLDDVDRHRTPFSALSGESMPGIAIHAQILAQLLDDTAPWQATVLERAALGVVVIGFGLVLGGITLSPGTQVGLALASIAALWGGASALQFHPATVGSMVPLAGLTLAWSGALLLGNLGARAVVSHERRFIRQALEKFVPPTVADELRRHPERLTISGTRLDIAVLFTDIAGFTTLSERLPPEQVAEHLNDYLDGMVRIVHDHQGTLDKFIGDAVVAFWGAPLPTANPAAAAIACAIDLDRYAAGFADARRAAGVEFGQTRIGVHFGPAVVGNFGGQDRFQYTAIGDTVNTAARLESANKFMGTRTLVSAAAVKAAGRDDCRAMGDLILKGRLTAIGVHEPRPDLPVAVLTAHRAALAALKSDPGEGLAMLRVLARSLPDDGALRTLVQRLEANEGKTLLELTEK